MAARAAWCTLACWRTSSEARWNPNVPTCQRNAATSPQAIRSRRSATSASWISTSSASRSSGPVVPAGQRRRLAGEGRAGSAKPLGDEPEALPVRLVGKAPAELAVGLGQVLGVAGQARHDRPGDLVRGDGGGDRLHQPRGHGLVAAQDVVRVDPQRLLGDLGGDLRVAVAVAADPAPPPEERRDAGRSRPGPAGVGGGARGSPGRSVERRVERPVEPRRHGEQGGVEERHGRAHLVERRRRHEPEVRGPPEQRDLLAQPTAGVAVLRGREPRVVEPLEQGAAPAQRHERRPPAGLGRVGRQDGRHEQPGDGRIELGVRPPKPAQPPHGIGDRIVEHAVPRGALAAPQGADAPVRLGQVHEAEVERKGPDDRLGGAQVQPAELVVEARTLDRVVVAAQGDGPAADPLDQREQLGTRLLRDHLAEQRAEEPDLDRERVPRAGRPDPAGLGGDGRRRPTRNLPRAHGPAPARPYRARAATASQPFGPATFRRLVRCWP